VEVPDQSLRRQSIAERLLCSLDAVRAKLTAAGVSLAYVFGSAAQGRERPDSDLDVAVLFADDVPRERYGELRVQLLTELVGLTHTNDVDLVVLNEAPPLLAFQVIDGGRLLLGDRREQVRFETRAIQRYIDTAPIRRKLEAALRARVAAQTEADLRSTGRW
jgi:predicted nucleotidyltransferase